MKLYLSFILVLLCVSVFAQEGSKKTENIKEEEILDYLGAEQINQELGFDKDAVESYQIGQWNELIIDQSSTSNQANYILSVQSGNKNAIRATQTGRSNSMELIQVGNHNEYDVLQYGNRNEVELTVVGNNNSFDISQEGNDNMYIKSMSGNNKDISVDQNGNENILEISGGIQIPLVIKQTGGMKLIIK